MTSVSSVVHVIIINKCHFPLDSATVQTRFDDLCVAVNTNTGIRCNIFYLNGESVSPMDVMRNLNISRGCYMLTNITTETVLIEYCLNRVTQEAGLCTPLTKEAVLLSRNVILVEGTCTCTYVDINL